MTEPAAAPTRTEPLLDSTTRADQSSELATTTLLRAAIGPVSADYYLTLFTRFDAQDRAGLRWNTAAALSTLNWMVFRRLWNAALAYTGIALSVALLVFGIGKLAFHYTAEEQWALAGLYALLLVGLPGFFGNALLFKHYRSEMARALASNHSIAEAAAMLAAQAPQRQRLLVLAALNAVLAAAVAALAVWASGFNGLPSALDLPAVAELPAPAASGNVAVGRALDAASAPVPTASASAPAADASVPAAPVSMASAPAAAASSPAMVASAPATTASAAVAPPSLGVASAPSARTPAPVASAPAATASTPTQRITLPAATAAGPEKKTDKPAKAVEKTQPPPIPGSSTREKTESARLAPHAAAQSGDRKPATKAKAPAAAAPAGAATVDKPGVPAGSFGINVGVFADANNARNAFVKLADMGLPAYTQELNGKKGKLTRVRVGPYSSAAEAERSAEKIRSLGLDALVFQQGEGR